MLVALCPLLVVRIATLVHRTSSVLEHECTIFTSTALVHRACTVFLQD